MSSKPAMRLLCGGLLSVLLVSVSGCQTPNATLRTRAELAMARGDLAAADTNLTEAIQQRETDWEALWLLGRLRLEQGRPLDAQVLLERALALHRTGPSSDAIEDDLAMSLYRQGDHAALVSFLEDTTRSQAPYDYLRQGRFLTRISDYDAASVALRKAVAFTQPPTAEPYLAQADLFEAVGDPARTINALRHAYYFAPDDRQLLDRMQRYGQVPGPTFALPPAPQPTE